MKPSISPDRTVPSRHKLNKRYRLRRTKKCAKCVLVVNSALVFAVCFMITCQSWWETFEIANNERRRRTAATTLTLTTRNTALEPNNEFDRHWNELSAKDSSEEWYPLVGTSQNPYSDMTPQLDVVWARGWYNAIPPPATVPLDYYNRAGLSGGMTQTALLEQYFPATLCGPRWMRIDDVPWFIDTVLPWVRCNFTLITGDGIIDVPTSVESAAGVESLLESPYLEAWYAQNTVLQHAKLLPIPVGLPIHYGFQNSPHSKFTVAKMLEVRHTMPGFRQRSPKILMDPGTMTGGGPRQFARMAALEALQQCPHRVEIMDPTNPVDTWRHHYSSHQFAIVVRGTGWDTYRTWEYLLFGTVPILLKGTPMMDHLHLPAHTPVMEIEQWSDICTWSDAYYESLVDRYEGWIANAHQWLRPSLWVPRNQPEMERLCDVSSGCRATTRPWISPHHLKPVQQKEVLTEATKQNDNHLGRVDVDDRVAWEDPGVAGENNLQASPPKDDADLGLSPEERVSLLRALLKTASQEEIRNVFGDDSIKEKVYQQLRS